MLHCCCTVAALLLLHCNVSCCPCCCCCTTQHTAAVLLSARLHCAALLHYYIAHVAANVAAMLHCCNDLPDCPIAMLPCNAALLLHCTRCCSCCNAALLLCCTALLQHGGWHSYTGATVQRAVVPRAAVLQYCTHHWHRVPGFTHCCTAGSAVLGAAAAAALPLQCSAEQCCICLCCGSMPTQLQPCSHMQVWTEPAPRTKSYSTPARNTVYRHRIYVLLWCRCWNMVVVIWSTRTHALAHSLAAAMHCNGIASIGKRGGCQCTRVLVVAWLF